jgi:lipopolysaccharide export system permease protein
MPLSLLVASVLVFSRMSADSEIAAMRSCGLNLYSVVKWPIFFGIFCTLISFVVNNEIVPRGHEVRRNLKQKVSVDTGLDLLEPGRFIDDFPKVKIYFEKREGNWLYDLVVMDYSDKRVVRMIKAAKALVTAQGTDVNFDLYEMTVDPVDADHPTMAQAHRFTHTIKNAIKERRYNRKEKDFRFREISSIISSVKEKIASIESKGQDREAELKVLKKYLSKLRVEFSKRFVFALANICFILMGIPLGVKSQRKESSIGMAISLGVSLSYYLVVILMMSINSKYSARPDILIYAPVIFCLLLSVKLMRKHL